MSEKQVLLTRTVEVKAGVYMLSQHVAQLPDLSLDRGDEVFLLLHTAIHYTTCIYFSSCVIVIMWVVMQ
jgi:hypothetical protein